MKPLTKNGQKVCDKMIDMGYSDSAWWEGYISALANIDYLTENDFDSLLEFIHVTT